MNETNSVSKFESSLYKMKSDQLEIVKFLKAIYPEGIYQIVCITSAGKLVVKSFERDYDTAAEFAVERNNLQENIYFNVNPLKEKINKKAGREDIASVMRLHIDIDPSDDKTKSFQERRKEAKARLSDIKKFFLNRDPSFVIDSGNGFQCLWNLQEPMESGKDCKAEILNDGLITKFGGDKGTYDCSRILRLPGTLNYPTPLKIKKGYPEVPGLAKLLKCIPLYVFAKDEFLGKLHTETISSNSVHLMPDIKEKQIALLENEQKKSAYSRLEKVLERNPKFKSRWEGCDDGLEDKSRSGMDMSVTSYLCKFKFNLDEIAYLLKEKFTHGKAADENDSYIIRMYEKIRPSADHNVIFKDNNIRELFEHIPHISHINFNEIEKIIHSSFHVGSSTKFLMPDKNAYVNTYTQENFKKAVILDSKTLVISENELDFKTTQTLLKDTAGAVINYLVTHRQIDEFQTRYDMFSEKMACERTIDGLGRIVKPHTKFKEIDFNQRIIDDYKEHFPGFADFIDMLVASRFASDRRKSFIWLHCKAGWGKNFLIDAFRKLNICLEISVKDVEKALAGQPIGIDFMRAGDVWILAFDEWRRCKAELKQLNNKIQGSAKHKLRTSVPLYLKLFMSAEEVADLIGESGIETQFMERFNLITGNGRLEDRKIYQEYRGKNYLESLVGYLAKTLNEKVLAYQELGSEDASKTADIYLAEYHKKNKIEADSLEENLQDIADEIKNKLSIARFEDARTLGAKVYYGEENTYFLIVPRLMLFVEAFIRDNFSYQERDKIFYKKEQLIKLIQERDGDKRGRHNLRPVSVMDSNGRYELVTKDEYKKVKGTAFELSKDQAIRFLVNKYPF